MHPTSKRSATATSHSDIYTVPKTGLNKFLALSSSVLSSATSAGVTFCPKSKHTPGNCPIFSTACCHNKHITIPHSFSGPQMKATQGAW